MNKKHDTEYNTGHFILPAITGAGRVLDFGATLGAVRTPEDGADADRRALMSDWGHVGADLAAAMEGFA